MPIHLESGVFCRRNCCVTFARCDGALSCMKTKSLPGYNRRHSSTGSREQINVQFSLTFVLDQ